MASDVGTGAQFYGSNMKPDPNEQMDCLWARNVADNTGFMYYNHKNPALSPSRTGQTFYGMRTPSYTWVKLVVADVDGSAGVGTANLQKGHYPGEGLFTTQQTYTVGGGGANTTSTHYVSLANVPVGSFFNLANTSVDGGGGKLYPAAFYALGSGYPY